MNKQHSRRSSYVVLPCCLVTALSICCQQQEVITDTSPSLLQDEVDFDVLVNEDMGSSYVTAGVVKNKSGKLYSFHTEILYYDSRERLIGTYSSAVFDLYPGTEQALGRRKENENARG